MNGDSLKEIIGLAYDYQIELSEESDRGAAILAAANFEEWLGSIISGYFAKLNSELKRKLFENGTLSTFSAKIDLGFALGFYDKDTLNKLHVILASPQNPKILVRDDSEIVGDGVAPRRPLSWQSSAEEIVDGFGEEGEAGVEAVVGHLAMHDAP